MNNEHVLSRMNQRGLAYDMNRLMNIAREQEQDTAVILGRMVSDEGIRFGYVLVILIVRNYKPITIMTRRESQNFTLANFNVQKIVRIGA